MTITAARGSRKRHAIRAAAIERTTSMRLLTPWLTGAGARSAEGTDIGHENAEGMAYVGVRVEPTVRLGTEVEGGSRHESFDWDLRRTA